MALTERMLNPAAAAAVADVVECSLHTAEPSGSGSNEISGGDYTRQPVEFGPAESGMVTATTDPEFMVPASNYVSHVGLWDSEGDFLGAGPLENPVDFATAGTYVVSPLRVIAEDASEA